MIQMNPVNQVHQVHTLHRVCQVFQIHQASQVNKAHEVYYQKHQLLSGEFIKLGESVTSVTLGESSSPDAPGSSDSFKVNQVKKKQKKVM